MRKRILIVALSAVLVAVALLGLPLAFAVQRTITSGEQDELERLALRGALAVPPDFRTDAVELPTAPQGESLALYGVNGALLAGNGPPLLEVTGASTSRHLVSTQTPQDVVASVPVVSNERVIAVIRAASARSSLRHRVWWAWAGLLGIAVVAASCAGALAAAQSRRLSRPLVALAGAATELGDGNFAVRAEPSGVREIDLAAASLNRTASRIADQMQRERAFSTHASHQLRTPLATLRLQLETGLVGGGAALTAAEAAISSADNLEQTIDDVLALARRTSVEGEGFEVEEVFDDLRRRWHGTLAAQDRPLRLTVEDPVPTRASGAATRQILHVLVENAYRHGSGAVTVRARQSGGALAIDVINEGVPPRSLADAVSGREPAPEPVGRNLGLPLARSLAEAEGGRVLLGGDESRTQVTLLLPARSTGESA